MAVSEGKVILTLKEYEHLRYFRGVLETLVKSGALHLDPNSFYNITQDIVNSKNQEKVIFERNNLKEN